MTDILLIVPSRGRPTNAGRLRRAWQATTEGRSDLLFLVDYDDETGFDYPQDLTIIGEPGRLVSLTNRAALANLDRYRVFGSIGDDHIPESAGWETAIMGAVDQLGGVAIVSGDDGVHGPTIPTACFVTSNIVRALGWMALPTLEHLACDLAWKSLAVEGHCWKYLPAVKITHHHPIAGRAIWDDTYTRGTGGDVSERDHAAYDAWMADLTGGCAADVMRIRALRQGA